MHVDGQCLCGFIAFEADVNPKLVFLCHCTDCQTQSGTAFRSVVVTRPEGLKLTRGEVKVFVKTAENKKTRSLAFCPECGTSIYGGPGPGETGAMSLRLGVVRQRAELRPRSQFWTRSAQPWIDEIHLLPKTDTQSAARTNPSD